MFSCDFYFHTDKYRDNSFQRVSQIHIISKQLGNKNGYQIVGCWLQKSNRKHGEIAHQLGEVLKNTFNEENKSTIEKIKKSLESAILNAKTITDYSRYSLNGFYSKLSGKRLMLDELVNKFSSETDDKVVSSEIRILAEKLKETLRLQKEISMYVEMKEDYESYDEIKNQFDKFIKETYLPFLNSTIKYDEISTDLSFKNLFQLDVNILKMLKQVRELISRTYEISPKFKIDDLSTKFPNDKLIEMFVKYWRDYLIGINEVNFVKFNNDIFSNYAKFSDQIGKLKSTCNEFLTYFKCAQSILIEIKNAQNVKDNKLEDTFKFIYSSYCSEVFKYSAHLDSQSHIVNYEKNHNSFINLIMAELIRNKTVENEQLVKFLNTSILTTQQISFNFFLNLIKYIINIEEKAKQSDQAKQVIEIQLSFLTHLSKQQDIQTDRIINCFNSYLHTYIQVTNTWSRFETFTDLSTTLTSIRENLFKFFKLPLENSLTMISKNDEFMVICDLIEVIENFMKNIENLKVEVIKGNVFELIDYVKSSYFSVSNKNHPSYELIKECLDILSTISQNSVYSNQVCLKYFDALNELLKEFSKQTDAKRFRNEKVGLFKHCLTFLKEKETDFEKNLKHTYLNDYLDIVKKIILIKGNQIEISSDQAISEFVKLNQSISSEEMTRLYKEFSVKFSNFKAEFFEKKDLNEIATNLRGISKRKTDIKDNMIEVLAGLCWILTANASKLIDSNGKLKEISHKIELAPHIIQILGCFRLLGLDRPNKFDSFANFLDLNPKQIGEILTGQGKSWQISLIALVYALFEYDVVVLCYSNYLSSRDQIELKEHFGLMSTEIERIKFKSLKELVFDEIDKASENMKCSSLVRQVIYESKYKEKTISESLDTKNSLSSTNTLYLIDEVDTVVSTEIESSYQRVVLVQNSELAKAFKQIYEDAKSFAKNVLQSEQVAKQEALEKFENQLEKNSQLASLIRNQRYLINSFREEVWRCARNVAFYYSGIESRKSEANLNYYFDKDNLPLFRLNKDCTFWEYYSDKKWSRSTYHSYYNSFFYLELFSKQSIFSELNEEAYGYMKLNCGRIYYSTLVSQKASSLLIGVTGSLKHRRTNESLLCKAELEILEKDLLNVNSENISYFPSFYGEPKVTFYPESIDHFLVVDSREKWIESICEKCEKFSNENKAVMVFFKEESFLKKILQKLLYKQPYVLTNNEISINEKNEFKKNQNDYFTDDECNWIKSVNRLASEHCSGQPGKISLIVSDYARGTDFKCNDSVNKNGGLHVIQTWFSEDPKEEIQVRGRTGRNGAPGVFMQIHCLEDLKENTFYSIDKKEDINLGISYDGLKQLAEISIEKKYSKMREKISQNKDKSNKALNWLNDARSDRAKKINQNRVDVDNDLIERYKDLILG